MSSTEQKTWQCPPCSFETDTIARWKQHVASKKHLTTIKTSDVKMYVCNYCTDIFKTYKSLWNHKSVCKDKNNLKFECSTCKKSYVSKSSLNRHTQKCVKQDTTIVQQQDAQTNSVLTSTVKILSEVIATQQKNAEFMKEVAVAATKLATYTVKKSMNALNYVIANTDKDSERVLKPLEKDRIKELFYEDAIIKKNMREFPEEKEFHLSEHLIYHFRHKSLEEYLCKLIVNELKTENPKDQVIYTSDVYRLIYIIKLTINNKNQWVYDKKGINISKSIIQPILDYIKEDILKYVRKMPTYICDMNTIEQSNKEQNISDGLELIKAFKSPHIRTKMVKLLAPEFCLTELKTHDENTNVLKSLTSTSNIEDDPNT